MISQTIAAVLFWMIFGIPIWLTIGLFVAGRPKKVVRK